MKIKKSITKRVKDALNDCRQTLSWAIIELCQQIDSEKTGEVRLQSPVTLSTSKTKRNKILVECNLANRIVYGPMDRMDNLFILYCDNTGISSSFMLTIGDLQIIYDELKRTILHK